MLHSFNNMGIGRLIKRLVTKSSTLSRKILKLSPPGIEPKHPNLKERDDRTFQESIEKSVARYVVHGEVGPFIAFD